MRVWWLAGLALLGVAFWTVTANFAAQDGEAPSGEQPAEGAEEQPAEDGAEEGATEDGEEQPAEEKPQPHYEVLWGYLTKYKYQQWTKWPKEDFYPGQGPHGDFLKTYVNPIAADNAEGFKAGSVIVKENFDADKKLVAVTVMQKTKEYAKETGNWYWVKYDAEGKVAMAEGKAIAGKVQGCIDCHKGAEGDDYVFSETMMEMPEPPMEDKPAEDKPAEDEPADDKPAEDKPVEESPAEDAPEEAGDE